MPENASLKGKRQIVKSIISRVQNHYHVSVAEIDDHDLWQIATLGIACISNDRRHANEMLSKIVDFIDQSRFEAELVDYQIEIMSVL
jgi:uncharacterized protein YlxP (DUF503 family)